MTRKERIKTYLTGFLIGVVLLVVWTSIRGKTQPQGAGVGGGAGGVQSPPAASEATGDERETADEGPRSTP